jgi:hypothetical protein
LLLLFFSLGFRITCLSQENYWMNVYISSNISHVQNKTMNSYIYCSGY